MADYSDINLTEEQKEIVSARLGKAECFIVNAYAGTGKTTTLREFAAHRLEQRILYICFGSCPV
jgi:superfamily II DNA or RNA helicase